MTKYIAFSVYGSHPKYIHGAIENARQASHFYPSWQAVFYVSKSVPDDVSSALLSFGAMVLEGLGNDETRGRFWRFQAILLNDATHVIFRDTDSRFSEREVSAVETWLEESTTLHIMRDHPFHSAPILAGMWGLKITPALRERYKNAISEWVFNSSYGDDQKFIARTFYRDYKKLATIHDSYFKRERHATNFPIGRQDLSFVGEIVDHNGKIDDLPRMISKKYIRSRFKTLALRAKDLPRWCLFLMGLNFY